MLHLNVSQYLTPVVLGNGPVLMGIASMAAIYAMVLVLMVMLDGVQIAQTTLMKLWKYVVK